MKKRPRPKLYSVYDKVVDFSPRGILNARIDDYKASSHAMMMGTTAYDLLRSCFGMQIFRMCVAESDRFPQIGQQFYNSGPAVMRAEMAQYFQEAAGRGELVIEDYVLAADQFGEL